MTGLQLFNYVFQFTGFRLAMYVKVGTRTPLGWALIGPVMPLTGWRTDFWPKNPKVRYL